DGTGKKKGAGAPLKMRRLRRYRAPSVASLQMCPSGSPVGFGVLDCANVVHLIEEAVAQGGWGESVEGRAVDETVQGDLALAVAGLAIEPGAHWPWIGRIFGERSGAAEAGARDRQVAGQRGR